MAAGLESEPARGAYDVAAEVLGWDVRDVCLRGPEDTLSATEITQPAVLTTSVAAARALEAHGLRPDMVAGHSVGELAALVVARALPFEDALRLVRARGRAMAAAGRVRPGRMAAVIGLDPSAVEDVCAESSGTVVVANVNAPGQVVISGEPAAVAGAGQALLAWGARRVIPLAVTVAAHSPLMAAAEPEVRTALEGAGVSAPEIPFASSAAGGFVADAPGIRGHLAAGVTGRVRWTDAVAALEARGARRFVEVGPGRVLSALVRRIVPGAIVAAVGTDAGAAAEARALQVAEVAG
jgi:[acyl-carrier-protein] S-malonyltransferase